MTLSPILIAAGIGIAVVCFFIGWMAKGSGANRREAELRREILEAKGSIPQLESSVRNRDTQISRLQSDLQETSDRAAELLRKSDHKERELRGSAREVKNLTSELTAIRGHKGSDGNNVIMDGFEDDTTSEPEGGSALESQLKKTEALYEKLKSALITRDERIDRLEAELADAGQLIEREPGVVEHAQEQASEEADALQRRLDEQLALVADLHNQIADLNKEKVMLEELASRRSKSNRVLKTTSAEAEARIPGLEASITEREQTITDREASIKRLLDELETTRMTLSERETQLQNAESQIAATREELASVQPKLTELEERIANREEQISCLDAELKLAAQNVSDRKVELDTAREHISEQEAEIAESQTALREQQQAAASLNNAIRDREFTLETLDTEVRELRGSLSSAQNSADETLEFSDKRHAVVAAEVDDAQQQVAALKRDIEDLQSQLEQRDQWMAKLKDSLGDREVRMSDQQSRADQLMAQLDGANKQLKAMDETRQDLESRRHELDTELVANRSKVEQAEAALAEQLQAVNVFKSMIADRDFRIESLENDLISRNTGNTPAASEPLAASGRPAQ